MTYLEQARENRVIAIAAMKARKNRVIEFKTRCERDETHRPRLLEMHKRKPAVPPVRLPMAA